MRTTAAGPTHIRARWLIAAPWLLAAALQAQEVKIGELARDAGKFVGRRITVSGRLVYAGRNYFTDPRFVLADEKGGSIPVNPWAPLEVPPPMPGEKVARGGRPRTMSDYLGRMVAVTGTFRADASGRGHILAADAAATLPEALGAGAPARANSLILPAGKSSRPVPISGGEPAGAVAPGDNVQESRPRPQPNDE